MYHLVRLRHLRKTHVEEENRGELDRLLRDGLVERRAGLGPRRPEVEERDAVQVLGEQVLEVLWRVDVDEVGGHFGLQRLGFAKWKRVTEVARRKRRREDEENGELEEDLMVVDGLIESESVSKDSQTDLVDHALGQWQ